MFKLLIKLAVAGLIANAAWRLGSAYAGYYKFEDAVQQTTQFGPDRSDAELRDRILELAAQYDVPLAEDGFTIERVENHTIVDGEYATPIQLFPGYERAWPFAFHVDTFTIKAAK
jgi:hypothetical protein